VVDDVEKTRVAVSKLRSKSWFSVDVVPGDEKVRASRSEKWRLQGARSVKRAGRAVELRPAPKARYAAHPQERQHGAAEGGTRDRVRPAGALNLRRQRRKRQGSSPEWAETRRNVGSVNKLGEAAPGAHARLEPGPKGTPRDQRGRVQAGTSDEHSS
jgi:hypothetical protein